jgi:uncharacterized repeat protein (TIGR01451 family)
MTARSSRLLLGAGSATLALALTGAPLFLVVPPASAAGSLDICHSNVNDKSPYVLEHPDANAQTVNAHGNEDGPIWNPTLKPAHIQWGDIIPPFDYVDNQGEPQHFDGLNWTVDGQAWLNNLCRAPITGTLDKTSDANGDDTFTDSETASAEGAAVTFQAVITNSSLVPVTVTGFVDSVSGSPIAIVATPDPVGQVLAPGASLTVTFTVAGYSPADGGSVVNTLRATLAAEDDATNVGAAVDTATVSTSVPPLPPTSLDLALAKVGPGTAEPGDQLTWTLTASNVGTAPASTVTLTDTLPAGTTLVSATGTGWDCVGTVTVTCTLAGGLPVGDTSAVTVVATLASGYASTSLSNTGVITTVDTNPANNTATATTVVDLTEAPVVVDTPVDTTVDDTPVLTPPITGGGGTVEVPAVTPVENVTTPLTGGSGTVTTAAELPRTGDRTGVLALWASLAVAAGLGLLGAGTRKATR